MKLTPAVVAPKGFGRPWYPVFTCTTTIERTDTSSTEMVLKVHGQVHRGHVGIRGWITRGKSFHHDLD